MNELLHKNIITENIKKKTLINGSIILEANIINKNCFISNNTKLAIALSAKEKYPKKILLKWIMFPVQRLTG